jgi:hypothetical protein
MNNGCDCISCLGAPWSGTVCKAVVGTERVRATAENERMLAETGRNFEDINLAADYA